MFVDTAKVSLKAGKGGDGAVSFRHEIYIPKGGPDGGDGGRGGSIIFRADKDTNTLLSFRYNPILTAENGKNGAGQRAAGRGGRDLVVKVPIGTVVYKIEDQAEVAQSPFEGPKTRPSGPERPEKGALRTSAMVNRILLADLNSDGAEAVIAKGGDGGFGNAHFKSSVRQTPRIAEVGEPGEEFEAELELKLLADVGLVGLPNAGKSTFLSVVSNAKPEIADYPFTTITPNLGVATIDGQDLLIADIPGLIEGASEGKGLGHAFLRHVDRTAVLLHLIDVYSDDAGEAYRTIRTELEKYSDLASRPEIVALTKCENLDEDIIKMQTASVLKVNPAAKVYTISSSAHQGLENLLRALKAEIVSATAATLPSGHRSSGPSPRADSLSSAPVVAEDPGSEAFAASASSDLPRIELSSKALKDAWFVTSDPPIDESTGKAPEGAKFIVTGEKIEKFARRTDLSNYASVNRLRDIMKKLGIKAELTGMGAKDDSIVSIAGKEFTLIEEDW